MSNPNPDLQTQSTRKTWYVEKDGVKYNIVDVDLSGLYGMDPATTACEIVEALGSVYREFREVYHDADIMINYSPDGVSVTGELSERDAKALVLLIDELKGEKSLSEAIATIKFFIDFDIDKVVEILKKTRYVFRLFDGYEWCYLIKLRCSNGV